MPKLADLVKPMSEAPRDGTMLIARYREWNQPGGAFNWHPVWWMSNSKGKNPTWRPFGKLDSTAFADGFVTPAEFAQFGEDDQPQAKCPPDAKAAPQEFDL